MLKSQLKDPAGYPDFTLPVSIVGQFIEELKVDIVAQTFGNLKVDIAAESIGNLGVDIKAQSVGNLNVNIAAAAPTVTLKVDISSQSVGNIGVDIKAQSVGNLNVNIAASSAVLNINVTNDALPVAQVKPALAFDETDDYVLVPYSPSLAVEGGDFTALVFAYIPPAHGGENYPALLDRGRYQAANFWIINRRDNNYMYFGLGYTDGTICEYNTGPYTGLHLFGIKRSGNTMYAIVDGSVVGSLDITKTVNVTNRDLYLGYNLNIAYFGGIIYCAYIYNRALSDSETSYIFNNPNSPPANGLVLWLPLDEGSGSVVNDKSGNGNNGTIYGATWVSSKGSVPATVNVNIASQVATLNVNITASAVTLNVNISSISSGVVFNVAQSGAWTVNAAQTGTWTINIGSPLDASGNIKAAIQSSVTLNVNIASQSANVNVNINAQSVNLNVYTGSGLRVMVGTGLITKFYKVAQSLASGASYDVITINGKGRIVSVGIKAYDISYSLAQNVELRIIADGATVYDARLDWLDFINGRQMSYALRSGTSSSPVYASVPLLNPEGGVVAGYGWVDNRNGINPDELLRLIEAYAIANVKVEFNSSCTVRIYNGSSGSVNLYVGVEYGLYP